MMDRRCMSLYRSTRTYATMNAERVRVSLEIAKRWPAGDKLIENWDAFFERWRVQWRHRRPFRQEIIMERKT